MSKVRTVTQEPAQSTRSGRSKDLALSTKQRINAHCSIKTPPFAGMPPLGVLLKEQELADILAFLDTLRTPPKDGITVPVKKLNPYE